MPEFIYHCPHCGQKYECDESWTGVKIQCQSCGKESVVGMPKTNCQTNLITGKRNKNNGCTLLLIAVSPLLFGILIGCGSGSLDVANWSIPIGLILTVFLIFYTVVASRKDAREKKNTAIFLIVLSVAVIAGFLYCCTVNDKPNPAKTDMQPPTQANIKNEPRSNISKAQVIFETRKALNLARQVSGETATGFHADHVLIGTDKATCHFSCYVNGRKHIGGMEFRISGSRLIPTGQCYLDPD